MLSQASRTSLPPIFSASPIHLPPIRRPPTRPHVPFYKLPSHTIPLKWSLYRSLLCAAPDAQHRKAIRGRWRKTRHRHCTSPRLTLRLLTFETQLLNDYRALLALNVDALKPESMRGRTLGDDAHVELGNNLDLPDEHVQAIDCQSNQHGAATAFTPYHELTGLSSESQKRLKKVHENLKAHYTSQAVSLQVAENYRMSLEQISYRLKSIRTPSLIFPSYLNPPIPRYKPQPLSTSMIMVHRQQARDRRIIQGRAWQEMLKHLKSEAEFDRSLGIVNENQPFDYVSNSLRAIRTSDDADFARAKAKFPAEMLQAREAARKSRHTVMASRKYKESLAARLEKVDEESRLEKFGSG